MMLTVLVKSFIGLGCNQNLFKRITSRNLKKCRANIKVSSEILNNMKSVILLLKTVKMNRRLSRIELTHVQCSWK